MKKHNELFNRLYYSLDSSAAYSSKESLYRKAKKEDQSVTRKIVDEWLRTQLPYTLHRPVRLNFKSRPVVVHDIDDQWQMHLVDLSKFSRFNSGYKFILVCIDVFSKYAWVQPLKRKSAMELKLAIKNIFEKDKRHPKLIQTDKGSEFLNVHVRSILAERDIKLFTTNSERKASVVERLNRTLKGIMFRYMTKWNTRKYIDV